MLDKRATQGTARARNSPLSLHSRMNRVQPALRKRATRSRGGHGCDSRPSVVCTLHSLLLLLLRGSLIRGSLILLVIVVLVVVGHVGVAETDSHIFPRLRAKNARELFPEARGEFLNRAPRLLMELLVALKFAVFVLQSGFQALLANFLCLVECLRGCGRGGVSRCTRERWRAG